MNKGKYTHVRIYRINSFEKVRKTKDFLTGVDRLRNGLDMGYTIVLMCSEAEPFDCHRFSLLSYHLTSSLLNNLREQRYK
ncbi:MAG: DUF488 family protein [wastewater metagenome]|nr:DUF488 family protein [Candidatus Loosdrechtia aerotolerans]